MGLGRIHKRRFKMKSTSTTKKRRQLVQVKWKWRNSPKPLGGGTTPLPIVYYVPFHKDYIEMLLFVWTPKTRTLTIQKIWMLIFFKVKSILKMQGQYFIAFENIFLTMYSTSQLNLIWPLLSRDLSSRVSILLLPFLLIITHVN
jgi:hypothetical protein